jgi:hypothetical protein
MQVPSINPVVAGIIIAALSLLVAILGYHLNRQNRKASFPQISVDWKVPRVFSFTYADRTSRDRFLFFEGLLTNTGGKTATLVEMTPDEDYFVRYFRVFYWEKGRNDLYERPYRLFLVSQSAMHYMSPETIESVMQETEIKLHSTHPMLQEVPMNIVVETGKTVRFTVCLYLPDYERTTSEGYNRVAGLKLHFNNGQTASTNLLLDDDLTMGRRSA